jgi:Ssp1 endopeptidase immunity protein Rap1a
MATMKRPTPLFLLLSLCLAPLPASAQIEHANGWGGMSGNDLLPLCQALMDLADGKSISDSKAFDAVRCGSYIDGFLDGFTTRDSAPGMPQMVCFPEGVTSAQMHRVVMKWLLDHPARLHEPAWGLVTISVREAFSCPSPPPIPSSTPHR